MKQEKFRISRLKLNSKTSTIIAICGVFGVLGTVAASIHDTTKAMKRIKEEENRRNEKLSNKEVVLIAAPAFISTFLCSSVTIAFIFASDRMHVKQEAAIAGAYTMISRAYQEYRARVEEINDGAVDKQALTEIHETNIENVDVSNLDDNKLLFFEEISGIYFESTMLEVVDAEYHFNRNYALRGGYGSLNEFYEFLGIQKTKEGAILGWSNWWGESHYGYTWVDFEHKLVTLDDGLECYIISYPFQPIANYEDYPEY